MQNYDALQANLHLLEQQKTPSGQQYNLVHLPMPAPYYLEGRRMPANYANFYIGNDVVLVPAFGDPNDEEARYTLQSCFPHRRVFSLDCRAIIWGLGAIHCLTQQVPGSTR